MMKMAAKFSPEIICRICQRATPKKGLIEPCNCNGSIGGVHKSCMERWLTISRRSKCELCGVSIPCFHVTPTFYDYAKNFPRPLVGDLLLFTFLTPIAILLTLLCFQGAMIQVKWQNLTESSFLLAFGAILLFVYFGWIYWSIKNNYQHFLDWRSTNTNLKIDWPRGKSSATTTTITSSHRSEHLLEQGDYDANSDDVFINNQPHSSLGSLFPCSGHPSRLARLTSSSSSQYTENSAPNLDVSYLANP